MIEIIKIRRTQMIKKLLYVLAIIVLILGSICCLYIRKEEMEKEILNVMIYDNIQYVFARKIKENMYMYKSTKTRFFNNF